MGYFRPCPFCGGSEQEVETSGVGSWGFVVVCECGIETNCHATKEKAIKQWNTRASGTQGEVE